MLRRFHRIVTRLTLRRAGSLKKLGGFNIDLWNTAFFQKNFSSLRLPSRPSAWPRLKVN